MKVLVIGAKGKLGQAVCAALAPAHQVSGHDSSDSPPFDMTDFAQVKTIIEREHPDIVLHTAGMTDVEGCAKNPQLAIQVNGIGTQNLAIVSHAWGIPLLYVSTNEVFDGTGTRPYYEYDPARPINPYGYSKWVGERAVTTLNPRHYIVRTSWLFAHSGRNFVQAILGAVAQGRPLRVVTDEIANPTYNDDLAQAIVALIQTGIYGTYHLVNAGYASRYAFARHVLDCTQNTHISIEPITSDSWQRLSTPPLFAPLENMIGAHHGITLRPWQQAVEAFIQKEAQK